jgi:hypothetical protein
MALVLIQFFVSLVSIYWHSYWFISVRIFAFVIQYRCFQTFVFCFIEKLRTYIMRQEYI